MNLPDKNIFSIQARVRLVELGWSQKELAKKIGHPRETVNRAILTEKFPRIRRKIAKKLKLTFPVIAA